MRSKRDHLWCTNRISTGLFDGVEGCREDGLGAIFRKVAGANDSGTVQVRTILLIKGIAERAVRKIKSIRIVGCVPDPGDIVGESCIVDDTSRNTC